MTVFEKGKIPEITRIDTNYDGKLQLLVNQEMLLCLPREERRKILFNEADRLLSMIDWEESRREVIDYVEGQENTEGD